MSSQTQPGGTYGSNLTEEVSDDAKARMVTDFPSGSLYRPPVPRKRTWRLPSVGVVVTTLQREACMLRIISKMFVGKGERVAELKESLVSKSHELDRFASSLQELP